MKLVKKIGLLILIFILCYACGYVLNLYISNHFVFEFKISQELLLAPKAFLYGFEMFAIICLMMMFAWYKGIGKNPKKLCKQAKKIKKSILVWKMHISKLTKIFANYKTIEYSKL